MTNREKLQRAAEAGDTEAMFDLALLLGDSDPVQARECLQRAAKAGSTKAINNLKMLEDNNPGQVAIRARFDRS
jgi:TPR repeat protein